MRERLAAVLGREPTLGECLAVTALRRLIKEEPLTSQFVNQKLLSCFETAQSTD